MDRLCITSQLLTSSSGGIPENVIESAEADGIADAEDTTRIARLTGETDLYPPRCALVHMVGDEQNARGALPPSSAKSTLTRDSQRRWALARQARRGVRPEFLMLRAILLAKG